MSQKKYMLITLILVGVITMSTKIFTNLSHTLNTNEVYISIERGASLKSISNTLKNKGIISSSTYFMVYTKFKGLEGNLKYGNYILSPKMELDQLLQKLQNPKSDYIVVTFPEGFSLYQIAKKLEENNLVESQKFMDVEIEDLDSNVSEVETVGKYFSLEGYLFPDTYYIPTEFREKDIAEMMFNRFKTLFTQEYYDRAEKMGLSIDEVLTIASLIEKEAANNEERSRIAGVIYNRLNNGMQLQIDATVIYGITKGEESIARVTYNDLKSKSDYNTYQKTGLPPGPIASPGLASIKAALYPEKHNYLYYVLGENGHVFSESYNEHLKNVRKYKK